jgi:ribosomal protein S27E
MTMFQTLHRMMSSAATLKITCDGCGHEATWTGAQALKRLGPDATPFDVRRRLRCGGCGHTGRARTWI